MLERPLIFVVNKWDAWKDLLSTNPGKKPLLNRKGKEIQSLDMDAIGKVSSELRTLLSKLCPEIVSCAESFCKTVVYLPASPLGITPQQNSDILDPETKIFLNTIRPVDIDPWWTEIPMLYAISREDPKMVEPVRRVPTGNK